MYKIHSTLVGELATLQKGIQMLNEKRGQNRKEDSRQYRKRRQGLYEKRSTSGGGLATIQSRGMRLYEKQFRTAGIQRAEAGAIRETGPHRARTRDNAESGGRCYTENASTQGKVSRHDRERRHRLYEKWTGDNTESGGRG